MQISIESRSGPRAYALVAFIALGLIQLSASSVFAAEDTQAWSEIQSAQIAEVASLTGRVEVSNGGAAARILQQGDPIYAGDRITTTYNSTAGLWLDEALGEPAGSIAQLEANSRVRFTRPSKGGARIELEKGAVRVLDPRESGSGPDIELAALDTETRMNGGDREARILVEKTGPYAVMCDWEKPLTVVRGETSETTPPGQCIVGNNREPLFASPAHQDRIPLLLGAPLLADAGPTIDTSSLNDTPPGFLPPVGADGPNGLNTLADVGPIIGLGNSLDPSCGSQGSPCNNGLLAGPPPPPPVVVIQQPPTNSGAQGL